VVLLHTQKKNEQKNTNERERYIHIYINKNLSRADDLVQVCPHKLIAIVVKIAVIIVVIMTKT